MSPNKITELIMQDISSRAFFTELVCELSEGSPPVQVSSLG